MPKKKIFVITAAAGLLVLSGICFLDERIFQAALPYAAAAKDENTALGGLLALLKIFGVADSLLIFVLAAGALGRREACLRVLIAFAIVGATVLPLKHLVGRTRPDQSENVSFPSGDTATAFVLPTAIGASAPATLAATTAASGVAFSRIMYQRHFLADVAAGAFIGLMAGFLSRFILAWARGRLRWLPPRNWFLLALLGALAAALFSALTDGHHRHVVQLVAWYGPALALFFIADYCRHRYRQRGAPAALSGENNCAAGNPFPETAASLLTSARVMAAATLAGVWIFPCGAIRLPLFSAALAVTVYGFIQRRFRRTRRYAAGKACARGAAALAGVYALAYLSGLL